jgi:outer membrane protein assembly factor BamB
MAMGRGQVWAGTAAAAWLALAVSAVAVEPPKLAGESPRTAQRFSEAADLEDQHRWADAVEVYLRLLDDAGDDLVAADGDNRYLLPARRLAHRRIAARSELLAVYRARVEPGAKRLLEQGEAERDPQLLGQVVDQFFCSRSAETALNLLGDLACERGEFDRARQYWRRLGLSGSSRDLPYPEPTGGPALARAKCILSRLLAGERAEAIAEFAPFRKEHADAAGHLAGRDGNLVVILQGLLDAADAVRSPVRDGLAPAAVTFGGDAARNGIPRGVLPPFSPERRYPPILLPGVTSARAAARPPVRDSALTFYPVIARGQVFIADARRVLAYDLATGEVSGRFDLFDRVEDLPSWAMAEPPLNFGGDFTLTVDGDRIYARLGPPHMRPPRGESVSQLACFEWHPEQPTPEERLKQRWTLPAAKADADVVAAWEGTPVVADGRLYAAVTRIDANRAVTAIACYRAADPSTGPIWQRDVYEAAPETADRMRPHLLTLAGPTVAFCSHAGVIVGLEATTGRRAWAVRYPTRATTVSRDPVPCAFADGRLYAAPADSDRLLCLDAATGSIFWSSEPLSVAHLLGVAGGRVVCTLGGFHAGLCAFDAGTGRRLSDWGYRVAGADTMAPFGRGLLFGDRVYWPTRAAGVLELRWDGTTGYVPTVFRELPGGNLAYGDGCLAVAAADRLHVLVADADAAAPGHRVGLAPDRRHELMLWDAERLRRSGRPANEIRAVLDEAAGPEFPPARRFLALARRAEFERQTGNSERAAAVAENLSALPLLRAVAVRDGSGLIRSVERWTQKPGSGRRSSNADGGRSNFNSIDPPVPAELRLPLHQVWRLPLDRGREWSLLPSSGDCAGQVYVAGRGWLASRSTADGSDRWRTDLAFAPTWSTLVHDDLITGGDNGAARLSASDGRIVWQFRLPQLAPWFDLPGWQDPNPVPRRDHLSGFQWVGNCLVARLGDRSILALDGQTGEVSWQRLALPMAAFHPAYFADQRNVVVQSSDGRRWVFDTADGRVLQTGPAPNKPWPGPPLALGGQRLLVVEDGRLVALDRSDWEPVWAWDVRRPVNLTGEPPQTRLAGGQLLVGVPRNDCFEVERLEVSTGRPLGDAIAVGREPVHLNAMAIDRERLTVVADGELKSIDCRDGHVLSGRTLESADGWRVESAGDGLLVWTVSAAFPTEAPRPGQVFVTAKSESERQRGNELSLSPGLGPKNALRTVRVVGDQVVIVTDGEVRGYRGAKREGK